MHRSRTANQSSCEMAWTRTRCPSHPHSNRRRPLRSDALAESEIASVPAPIGRGHHWIFGLNTNPATTTHATCAARRSCRTCMPRQPPQRGKKRLPPPPTRASEPANLVADPGREACIYVSLICDKVMAAPVVTEKTQGPKFAPGAAMAKQSTVAM